MLPVLGPDRPVPPLDTGTEVRDVWFRYADDLPRVLSGVSSTGPDPVTGVVLSGGQWQRLALARAVFRRDTALVVPDEPSAGPDAEAEHELHERLRELRADGRACSPPAGSTRWRDASGVRGRAQPGAGRIRTPGPGADPR
jgi:hypothetical protein